jgi:hypothetical protein
MKINDQIEIFLFQLKDGLRKIVVKEMNPVNVRIEFQEREELLFCQEVDLSFRSLFFNAPANRRGKNNVPNGRKADNQDFQSRSSGFFRRGSGF